ncbi:hypothetical protein GCM10022631_34900 [Deinococcus rubellus]|uniref:Uncharacterized protein n=1 Tax=Deinococcus rubellus TaxID=1889240 RepID=A0ABY5YEP7_9DEIO|nr:hypothetical protein [Deinococcus rubellus]UWX63542.1 hypothetical protein N0D28_12455 [Deinococcus rubellus]
MNKLILTAILPFAAALPLASAAAPTSAFPPPAIVSGGSTPVGEHALYTESNWERISLPAEALSKLGNLRAVRLTTQHLPSNVHVALSLNSGPINTIGLNIWRGTKTEGVYQNGLFTLTNPLTGASYTFEKMVIGSAR